MRSPKSMLNAINEYESSSVSLKSGKSFAIFKKQLVNLAELKPLF